MINNKVYNWLPIEKLNRIYRTNEPMNKTLIQISKNIKIVIKICVHKWKGNFTIPCNCKRRCRYVLGPWGCRSCHRSPHGGWRRPSVVEFRSR